jgi:hypothetical protein
VPYELKPRTLHRQWGVSCNAIVLRRAARDLSLWWHLQSSPSVLSLPPLCTPVRFELTCAIGSRRRTAAAFDRHWGKNRGSKLAVPFSQMSTLLSCWSTGCPPSENSTTRRRPDQPKARRKVSDGTLVATQRILRWRVYVFVWVARSRSIVPNLSYPLVTHAP